MNFYGSVKKNLKESWFTFRYTSGGNPYIAKSEKERDRLLKKYKGKVKQTGPENYTVDDKEPEWGPPADLDLDKELKEEEFQGDPNDDPDWHPESRRPDKDAADVVWPSDDKLYMQWRDPDGKPYPYKITVAEYKKLSIDDKMALDDKIKKEYGPIGSFGVDMSKVRAVKRSIKEGTIYSSFADHMPEKVEPESTEVKHKNPGKQTVSGDKVTSEDLNSAGVNFKVNGEKPMYVTAFWSSNEPFPGEDWDEERAEWENPDDVWGIYFEIYDENGDEVDGGELLTYDLEEWDAKELCSDMLGLCGYDIDKSSIEHLENGSYEDVMGFNESEEKIDWKKEEKQLMSDMTKVHPKALKQFHKTFKDQGKTKFAERTKREMDRRGLKESSGELEELVRKEFASGKAPDEIQYKGKTYKAFNVMDMGRASDSSLIYYCNMENTPSGDPQESNDYFMVNTKLKLNPDGKGFKGVKEINYIDDLTESENTEDVVVMGFNNQFNTTVKQVKIDYKNKTYKIGSFKMKNDKKLSRKDFYDKIEELEKSGFKELKESQKLKESSDVIWSSETSEDDYDPEELKEQYAEYLEGFEDEEDAKSFEDWKWDWISSDDGMWDIKQEDLDNNIKPMIDKQVNNGILIVSGGYNSNYPDFRPSGEGGKLVNNADDLIKWLSDEDRVDFLNINGALGVAGYDHDGSIQGILYTLPDDPEVLLKVAKATDYYSADDSDEEILEEFKYDVEHDYYDMRDFFPVADKFVPIKVEW